MKKSKIVGCLSSAFVALVALASCQGIVKDRGHVVLYYNGKPYTAEELFADQKSSAAYDAKFNAVLRVAVRQWAANDGVKYKEEIENNTKVKISGQKSVAQSNADKNGTSYDTEWNKILTSNGVENESQLYDKFEYEYQKEKFDDDFYANKFDILKNGGYLSDGKKEKEDPERTDEKYIEGYLPKKQPYHVKHILVKVTAAAGDNCTGEITKDEAERLYNVITELAEGRSFDTVAKNYSQDTGSAAKGGDLGIMDRDTSYVNEFKLGAYMFESFFLNNTSVPQDEDDTTTYAKKNAKNHLFGTFKTEAEKSKALKSAESLSTLKDPTTATYDEGKITAGKGIGVIPFEAALMLGSSESSYKITIDGTEKTKKGVSDIDFNSADFASAHISSAANKAKYYPRNVIFNKYFNKHNIMVIAPRSTESSSLTVSDIKTKKLDSDKMEYLKATDDFKGSDATFSEYSSANSFVSTKSGFKNEDGLVSTLQEEIPNVLCDNENRPIFVFRSGTTGDGSYQGIHFVVIERSPFIGKEYETEARKQDKQSVNLDEYFTKYTPNEVSTDNKYPFYDEAKKQPKTTYVNYTTGESKDYVDRADAVKSKVKGYDSNINTYIYDYLLKTGSIQFSGELGETIKDQIQESITRKREKAEFSAATTWDTTWKTYTTAVEEQTRQRVQVTGEAGKGTGIIAEACAFAYVDWKENKGAANHFTAEEMKKMFDDGGVFNG